MLCLAPAAAAAGFLAMLQLLLVMLMSLVAAMPAVHIHRGSKVHDEDYITLCPTMEAVDLTKHS
jgi:hypothetical protein